MKIVVQIPDKETADMVERALASAGLCLAPTRKDGTWDVREVHGYLRNATDFGSKQ